VLRNGDLLNSLDWAFSRSSRFWYVVVVASTLHSFSGI
jgi:hypothetical protein